MPRTVSPISLKRKLRKIGGSLATTLPKEVVEILKVSEDDWIEFYAANGDVCVRKAKTGR
jgi:antitoxin component of MazEF toxin-antitoxin module